ncbi:LD-carboxypeptidase [Planctomyces sp. SH-PL62]|uniref:S66 peptidase family protein n=1 Tax=Planctomyces sp. SH-PL62 TaxID=1636152 RepID=UPI00078E107B|nr:LD-carboxypeptidase [Planctomyces sp. SH-PL62]AMV36535.1 putative murein peptide carboxypeptidase [Planctomyces sp. SH-PL62]
MLRNSSRPIAFLAAFLLSCALASGEDWTRPRPLRAGDVIRFVAPAGVVSGDEVRRCRELFEAKGYKVVVPENIERRHLYLNGTDEERAAELNEALRDPEARAVFACRGGYGLTRILDRLDYDALAEHPKIVLGFSDLTGLHLAIGAKCRLVSFHGPMPLASLNREDGDRKYASDLLWRLLRTGTYADSPSPEAALTIPAPSPAQRPKALVPGKATGRLTGGNLSLVAATVGTPYQIETKGRILFLEDTHEAAYRVDRMLSQLRLAGLLDGLSGVVLGSFDGADEKELAAVFRDYFADRGFPVLAGFPVGHIPHNAALPYGVPAEIDADAATLRLLESPLAAE